MIILIQKYSQNPSKSDMELFETTQCAPGIFNLDQKFHGVSCFWGLYMHKIVQNQSRKTSVIRLPKE